MQRIVKRIEASQNEANKLYMAVLRPAATLGISVDLSEIARALWKIYLLREEDALQSMPTDGLPERRPAKNDAVGIAEMIGEALLIASRRHRCDRYPHMQKSRHS